MARKMMCFIVTYGVIQLSISLCCHGNSIRSEKDCCVLPYFKLYIKRNSIFIIQTLGMILYATKIENADIESHLTSKILSVPNFTALLALKNCF